MINKGAVACGHEHTAKAAAQILLEGGNAFDAVVAAHFAACVAEPVLASLGGGGFLTAHPANGNAVVYDFFAHTPRNKLALDKIDFFPITADFGETTQEFHIGMGSIAVPGSVKGMFAIHQDLCSMPLSMLLEPAIQIAREGIAVNEFQAYIFDIVKPIYQSNKQCLDIYKSQQADAKQNQLVQAGENMKQPSLADTLEALVNEGDRLFYHGDIASSIVKSCKEHGGLLLQEDFSNYQTIKRTPLQLQYREHRIYSNPPPSSGGLLIAFALKLLEQVDVTKITNGSSDYLNMLVDVMQLTNKARIDVDSKNPDSRLDYLLNTDYLQSYRQLIADRYSFNRGTTHMSVIDNHGNVASLTVSNGEGSGYIAPHTGIMLNNMLGEQDLNPHGFNQWQNNQRISSMMAPTIIFDSDDYAISLGSGGSNRLRTAILQVIIQLLDYQNALKNAVEFPRIHFEELKLNIESGLEELKLYDKDYHIEELKHWNARNLYFGGVHCVIKNGNTFQGMGDPRRGGVAIIV